MQQQTSFSSRSLHLSFPQFSPLDFPSLSIIGSAETGKDFAVSPLSQNSNFLSRSTTPHRPTKFSERIDGKKSFFLQLEILLLAFSNKYTSFYWGIPTNIIFVLINHKRCFQLVLLLELQLVQLLLPMLLVRSQELWVLSIVILEEVNWGGISVEHSLFRGNSMVLHSNSTTDLQFNNAISSIDHHLWSEIIVKLGYRSVLAYCLLHNTTTVIGTILLTKLGPSFDQQNIRQCQGYPNWGLLHLGREDQRCLRWGWLERDR